ncbi:MAG: SO2930 family diheme c-type cytochrome [Pseudomonadota bacterium]
MKLRAWLVVVAATLLSCGRAGPAQPVFHTLENPARLSAWQLFRFNGKTLTLNNRVVPYDLNSALFSDYAHKLRTVWLPEGSAAAYDEAETFAFPVGTVISKTFYYPTSDPSGKRVLQQNDATADRLLAGFDLSSVKLIETRLLVRREHGWDALPYVWNADQTEAMLKRAGDLKRLDLVSEEGTQSFPYVVPNANQCAGCHATNATTRELRPIGPKARHLNRSFAYATGVANQLQYWQQFGLLENVPASVELPRNAVWNDASEPLDQRARAYLDINCAHCHNAVGPADTSGLHLEASTTMGPTLGRCKPPIAAGTGTGDRQFDIVPGNADASIFAYRMAATEPAVMMPELGRSLAHAEGVRLISDWIDALDGSCEVAP